MAKIGVPEGGVELDERQVANLKKLAGTVGGPSTKLVSSGCAPIRTEVNSSITKLGDEILYSLSVITPDMIGGFDVSFSALERSGNGGNVTTNILEIGNGTKEQIQRLLNSTISEI